MNRQTYGKRNDSELRSLRRLLAPAIACGFFLVGCGGGESTDLTTGESAAASASESGDSASAADETAADSEGSAASAERDPDVGPLEALLGFGGDSEEMAAEQMEQMRKGEEIIAACMRAEGFEYTPFVPDNMAEMMSVDFDETDRASVAEKGFGISTTFGDAYQEMDLDGATTDPNQAFVETLSEADQEAYYKTLFGDMAAFSSDSVSDIEGEDEGDMSAFEPSGCQGEAYKEQFAQFAVFEEFGDDLDTMFERFTADPRIVELDKKWAECMRTAGYEFTNPDSMYTDVSDRMDALFESSDPLAPADWEDLSEDEFNALTEAEQEAIFAPPAFDDAKLAEVQTYEKSVALANFDCADGEDKKRLEIQHEYEQLFIDENPAILEAGN